MTKEYRVVGAHSVLGRKPGDTLKASDVPDREQLARLIGRGSLQAVPTTTKVRDTDRKEQD